MYPSEYQGLNGPNTSHVSVEGVTMLPYQNQPPGSVVMNNSSMLSLRTRASYYPSTSTTTGPSNRPPGPESSNIVNGHEADADTEAQGHVRTGHAHAQRPEISRAQRLCASQASAACTSTVCSAAEVDTSVPCQGNSGSASQSPSKAQATSFLSNAFQAQAQVRGIFQVRAQPYLPHVSMCQQSA
jgi:hypothetical protein